MPSASAVGPGVPRRCQPAPGTRAGAAPVLQQTVAEADSFQDRFEAEVWLLDMSTRLKRFVPDAEERLELLRLVHREATRAGLRPDLVVALIHERAASTASLFRALAHRA